MKNQLGSKNFTCIYNFISKGFNPTEISKATGFSKQKINYYISTLKRLGFIKKVGYGTWEVLENFDEKKVKKTTVIGSINGGGHIFTSDMVRGHAFQFKLKIPDQLKNWDKREKIFNDLGFKFDDLMIGGIKKGQKAVFLDKKIWLTDKSIIIHEKASYVALLASESKSRAVYEFLSLIRRLEHKIKADFKINNQYVFKVSRQHYSLIKNALAKQYDKDNQRLFCYTGQGLWLIVDNSFNLHELETVHPKTADTDNKKVQDFFNGIKESEDYTPQFVTKSLGKLSDNLGYYGEQIVRHIKAVEAIENNLGKQTDLFKKISKTLEDLKKNGS